MNKKLKIRSQEFSIKILQMILDSIKHKNFSSSEDYENYFSYLLKGINDLISNYGCL